MLNRLVRDRRYRIGFAFGKFEHRTREIGYGFLVLGWVALGAGWYWDVRYLVLAALAMVTAAVLLESFSYVAHRLEKKTMDGIRFGNRR